MLDLVRSPLAATSDLGLLPKRETESSCCPSNTTTNAIRGEWGCSDLLYTSAEAYTSVRRKGSARVEGAPADGRMVDKASGTVLYTAGFQVSEFHQRE